MLILCRCKKRTCRPNTHIVDRRVSNDYQTLAHVSQMHIYRDKLIYKYTRISAVITLVFLGCIWSWQNNYKCANRRRTFPRLSCTPCFCRRAGRMLQSPSHYTVASMVMVHEHIWAAGGAYWTHVCTISDWTFMNIVSSPYIHMCILDMQVV